MEDKIDHKNSENRMKYGSIMVFIIWDRKRENIFLAYQKKISLGLYANFSKNLEAYSIMKGLFLKFISKFINSRKYRNLSKKE
jgi:hypothetical protein